MPYRNFSGILRDTLHTTPRGAVEFALVVLALARAEPTAAALTLGAVVSAAGEVLRIWAAGYALLTPAHLGFQEQELPKAARPEVLACGPFRWVRYPYLLGSALIFLGLMLAARDIYGMIAALLLLTAVYVPALRREEARLSLSLGPWQEEYEAEVPAFLPRLTPARLRSFARRVGRFSFEYALLRGRHRELNAVCAWLLAAAALYLTYLSPMPGSTRQVAHLSVVVTAVCLTFVRFVYYAAARRHLRSVA